MRESAEEACLYVAMRAPRERHDLLLRELVHPVTAEIRDHPDLDSLFVVRYDDPTWELRFRMLGRPDWIAGAVRPRVERSLAPFLRDGVIEAVTFGEYAREWDRYGGPLGMRLAEKLFLHDTLACLAWLNAEHAGRATRSRREYSLLFTERFLDLFGFDARQRLRFYREGHEWAFRDGVFRDEADRARLEQRYQSNRAGLRTLVFGADELPSPAAECLAASEPVTRAILAGLHAGTIQQDPVQLVWSYAHMHCNRLGIDVVGEAILRYMLFRLYEESAGAAL